MWIPFSQLRFNPRTDQTWGLNLYRFRPTLNEADYWILIPRTVRAWSSRFGEVTGISGIVPPRRIEALPYIAGGSTINADRDTANPFDDGPTCADASAPTSRWAWARTSRSKPRSIPTSGRSKPIRLKST